MLKFIFCHVLAKRAKYKVDIYRKSYISRVRYLFFMLAEINIFLKRLHFLTLI